MTISIMNKVIDKFTGELIGYKVTTGDSYSVVVTEEKAKEIGVEDIDIACYLDVDIIEAIKIGVNRFALADNYSEFHEEYEDYSKEYLGDKVLYYGYYFEDSFIMQLDSDIAINRMISASQNLFY